MSPMLAACVDCNRPAQKLTRGRCPECRRAEDQCDYYQSKEWRRLRRKAKADSCAVCGGTDRLTVHHGQARREGGADALSNLQVTLCGQCHSQFEADKRAGDNTELVRIVNAIAKGV